MSSSRVITIGLCGLGTVGQGVWKHLTANQSRLEARLGARLEIVSASVRDLSKKREVAIPADRINADPLSLARDSRIDIVCELMGGTGIAREVTLAALRAGKTVVSANKALLCEHGQEVLDAARENRGAFFFEASVAGGIPIIKALQEGLVANRFGLIYGILNGTCNYILTRMEREGLSYPEILADAKRLGYAEADETLDVEGWDTAHKAAVLAHLAHGRWVSTDEMIVQGISAVSQSDIRRARELGYVIKLLALIERDFRSNSLSVRVHPTLVPTHHVLANVNEVYNGISVAGDVAGTTFYIGRGAGQDATASAVISDIVDAASQLLRGPAARPGAGAQEPLPSIACASTICSEFYLRLLVADAPGVLAQIASLLAKQQISIASVLQKPADASAKAAELFLTTHSASEAAIATAVTELAGLPSVLSKPALIRIGSF